MDLRTDWLPTKYVWASIIGSVIASLLSVGTISLFASPGLFYLAFCASIGAGLTQLYILSLEYSKAQTKKESETQLWKKMWSLVLILSLVTFWMLTNPGAQLVMIVTGCIVVWRTYEIYNPGK